MESIWNKPANTYNKRVLSSTKNLPWKRRHLASDNNFQSTLMHKNGWLRVAMVMSGCLHGWLNGIPWTRYFRYFRSSKQIELLEIIANTKLHSTVPIDPYAYPDVSLYFSFSPRSSLSSRSKPFSPPLFPVVAFTIWAQHFHIIFGRSCGFFSLYGAPETLINQC